MEKILEKLCIVAFFCCIFSCFASAPLRDGLIGYWNFEDGTSPSVIYDKSGSGVHGSVIGSPMWSAGLRGQAIEIRNSSGHIVLGTSNDYNYGDSQDFSVSVWVKTDAIVNDGPVIGNKNWASGANIGWVIAPRPATGSWQWNYRGELGSRLDYRPSSPALADNQWHMLTVTHDRAGNATFYFDGAKQSQIDISASPGSIHAGYPTVIGTDGTQGTAYNRWWNGLIDEVSMWNRALSESEVAELFGSGQGVSLVAPIAVMPLKSERNVDVSTILSWDKSDTNAELYDLYFGTSIEQCTPEHLQANKVLDMQAVTTWEPPAGNESGDLDNNTTYYWRIIGYEPDGIGGYTAIDGGVLEFTTIEAIPVITQQPITQVVEQGATAVFSVSDVNGEMYQWYKQGNPEPLHSGEGENTFIISNVQLSDEGYYYCVISNSIGDVSTDEARLWTERLIGHFALDGDIGNSAQTSTPSAVGVPQWTTGIDGQAFDTAGTNNYISLGNEDDFNFEDSIDFTVSLWIKLSSINNATFISNKNWASGANTGWIIAPRTSTGSWWWNWRGAGGSRIDYMPSAPAIADNQWHMLTVTHDRDGFATFYFDGIKQEQMDISVSPGTIDTGLPTNLGADGVGGYVLDANGAIDDVRIYNYVISPADVAYLYTSFNQGEDICIDIPKGDLNGDCRITLIDFSIFSESWLECNLIPDCN